MQKKLYSLSFELSLNYEENLERFIELIDSCDDDSIIVAPEVVLSGFDYDNFEKAALFSLQAIEKLLLHVDNKIVIFTCIEKREDGFYNFAKTLYKGKVIYEQAKAKLFTFGGEHHYFVEGKSSDIEIFEIGGIKIAILICFELRFKELWKKVEGADVIALPAYWGKNRVEHFKTLSSALAIMNQCFVIASDAKTQETGGECSIISPFGNEVKNRDKNILSLTFDKKEIQKMRRYMDVGIGC